MAIKVGEKDLFPYLGDYGPVSIYKGEQKLAGYKWAEKSGQELHFDNTYNSHVEVEVDGKSYQDGNPNPNNPSEIHSLNDFDMVSSVGERNLLKHISRGSTSGGVKSVRIENEKLFWTQKSGGTSPYYISTYAEDKNANYILSFKSNTNQNIRDFIHANGVTRYSTADIVNKGEYFQVSLLITNFNAHNLIYFYGTEPFEPLKEVEFWDLKLEEVNSSGGLSPYAPAPEDITEDSNHPLIDKINLSLSEPLRSVGDVKDRLFKDSGGVWKIERNIGARILDGSEGWGTYQNTYHAYSLLTDIKLTYEDMPNTISTHFGAVLKSGVAYMVENQINVQRSGSVFIAVRETFKELREFTEWLSNNNVEIYYQLEEPYTETLDQEFQHQLNTLKSFKGSNYVYTVLPDDDLTPTIHAKTEVKDI